MKKLFQEPLLHFALLGVALFALNAARQKSQQTETSPTRIDVTASVIERLSAGFERQFGKTPDRDELRELVTAHVREEVYCREALALGLERDDTIVRRRLAQKMEFLTDDLASAVEPGDAAVRAYFEKNASRYAKPAQLSFRHVYFSKEKRGANAEAAAAGALAQLRQGANHKSLGDAFLHGFAFAESEAQEIVALFGSEFATQVSALPEGRWSGPVVSSYGLHLVRIDARGASQPASFEDVRATVVQDFNEERRRTTNQEIFEKLRERYQVAVDEAALERTATSGSNLARR